MAIKIRIEEPGKEVYELESYAALVLAQMGEDKDTGTGVFGHFTDEDFLLLLSAHFAFLYEIKEHKEIENMVKKAMKAGRLHAGLSKLSDIIK